MPSRGKETIPLELEVIPQVKDLLDEDLVRKSLIPCALLVPKIGIIRHQIPMIGGVATCPFAGERRRGSRVRFPKEERCAESPPTFICEKRREKPKKTGQNENSKFGSCIYT